MIHRADTVPLTPEEAFALFARTTAWWPHPGRLQITPHKGGDVTEIAPDGTRLRRGTVIAWDEGRYLAFTWSDDGQPETVVAVSFHATATGTRVDLTHGSPEILGDLADAVSTTWLRGWALTLGSFCAAARARETA